jgi:hypothetical protein
MTEQQLLEGNLARWLEPAGVQLDNERVPLYLQAVLELSGDLAGRELDVVRAAHDQLEDPIRAWIATAMRNHDQGFVGEGKDALLARLAGAAVIQALLSRIATDVTLVNLAIESARFLGLTPVIVETTQVSTRTLLRTAKQVRERAEVTGRAADTVAELPAERKADEETGTVVTADDLAPDLFAHAEALRALAGRVDELESTNAQLQAALDEEVEILWWVLLGRDAAGTRWPEHAPFVRAVIAARELNERTLRSPGPPAAGYFLTRVLGDDAETAASIGDLAGAGAPMDELPSGGDSLLPITSTINAHREVGGEQELWPKLAEAKFKIPVTRHTTLAIATEQLYRELEMLELLKA